MMDLPDDTVASINCFEISNLLPNLTLDQTIPILHGAVHTKTPGKSSPRGGGIGGGQGIAEPGRTMKECEDQLGALKKENFNLKLRIYLWEEHVGMRMTSSDQDAIKKNIELKVEIESLKKELIEKQELLSRAAKAMELNEEQKQVFTRNQAQYQQTLQHERERANRLEKELQECRERLTDATYYEETFGIAPEKALEYKDKLNQVEEIKSSLESELKQLTDSLKEERNWAKELETERDEFRNRLEFESISKEKLSSKKDQDIEILKEKVKELNEQIFKRGSSIQQLKSEAIEKDKIICEKSFLLVEKCKAYEEVSAIAEKRKRQIDQLRLSVKTRDDALTDLNNKNRSLLTQFENNYAKRCVSPASSSIIMEESQNLRSTFNMSSPIKSCSAMIDFEPSAERNRILNEFHKNLERRDFKKDIEGKECEIKKCEESRKQLSIKLYNVEKSAEFTDQKLKKLEVEHRKAIQMIQGFMRRHDQLQDKQGKKDRRIMELEVEISRLQHENLKSSRSSVSSSVRRNLCNELIDGPERDHNGQQRSEEMESKINDLRDPIDAMRTEKNFLEKQIQIESEELRDRLKDKDLKIEFIEYDNNSIKDELKEKIEELDKLKVYERVIAFTYEVPNNYELENLREELTRKHFELENKNQEIERLSKDLQIKTQNQQQFVNIELWSKNKEIAQLHNYMTESLNQEKGRNKLYDFEESAASQLNALVKELSDIGIQVTSMNNIVQLNDVNSDKPVDVTTISSYIHKLIAEKSELENEVDYFKWLKLVSKSTNDSEIRARDSTTARDKEYCELLRTHLKEMVKFMKYVLKSTERTSDVDKRKQDKIVFDALVNSKILSDDFLNALEGITMSDIFRELTSGKNNRIEGSIKKSKFENFIDSKNQSSTPSDSETFSEPDRMVSLERMGLTDVKQKSVFWMRPSKFANTFSDSEDSIDYNVYHKTYRFDVIDFDMNRQIHEIKNINSFLYLELNTLKDELHETEYDNIIDGKLSLLLMKLVKSQSNCEKVERTLKKKMYECHVLKKESKQNSVRKVQLDKNILELESMALEVSKQKTELLQYKENTEKKTKEILATLNMEKELLKAKIKKLEEESEESRSMILKLTRDLDHLTLSHSQILVDNTKLTNDRLRLEQELRKSESRYDITVRTLQDKFQKEVIDLNQSNESRRDGLPELEAANKEIRRHVVICEANNLTSSSSGISLIPVQISPKQACDDIREYHAYNGSEYWIPVNYPTSSGGNNSSCSPDLGIESDAAMTSTRPLKDTLKITESMSNFLSEDDNCHKNQELQDTDGDSQLPTEGYLLDLDSSVRRQVTYS